MTTNFRIYPSFKTKVLYLKNKDKLTLGRFKVSYEKYLRETKVFNKFNNYKLKFNINSLKLTPKVLKQKIFYKIKNAHIKSIN